MRNTIVTVVAVAGVVAAGAAAAVINTSIFDSPAPTASAATEIITSTSPQASIEPVVLAVNPSAAVTSTVPAGATPSTAAIHPASLTNFAVGEAGVVTLDVVDGRLALIDAVAASGWEISETEQEDDEVVVTFRSNDAEVEFEAELVAGQVMTYVEAEPLVSYPAIARGHDDDHQSYDDDSYDDDSYDDGSDDEEMEDD